MGAACEGGSVVVQWCAAGGVTVPFVGGGKACGSGGVARACGEWGKGCGRKVRWGQPWVKGQRRRVCVVGRGQRR